MVFGIRRISRPTIFAVMRKEGRAKNITPKKFKTKITGAVVPQQNASAEEKKAAKTRNDFPETWLWQTIQIK